MRPEARTVARLERHPSIVGVYDVGRQEDGSLFVVLEFVEGHSLRQELRSTGKRLPAERVWEVMIQATSAIQHARAAGLVHRDLKPPNILLDPAGNAHVTDFGLAVDEESQRRKVGELSGTAAYMAPEQVRGETHRLDGRADLWALGVILYEMLTGRPPFRGRTREEIYDEILHREPKPPRQLDPEIDEGLEEICLRCLSKSITERYATAADLAKHLRKTHPEQRRARKRRAITTAVWIGAALLALMGTAWAYLAFRTREPQITINPAAGIHVHLLSTLVGHGGEVWSAAFAPDDKTLASAGVDKVIKLWDVETSQPSAELTGHLAEVCDVAFAPDGQTLAGNRSFAFWRFKANFGHASRRNIRTYDDEIGLDSAFCKTPVVSYPDDAAASQIEQRIRDLLADKRIDWRLEMLSERPAMKERRANLRLVKELQAIANHWELPLERESSVWPSVAGLVAGSAGVVCGVGPVARNLYTPLEMVDRISLLQKTLLLAQLLAQQGKGD